MTTGSKVYVLDPEQMILTHPDTGRQLTPAEIVEEWRSLGTAEPLPPGADPVAVALGR